MEELNLKAESVRTVLKFKQTKKNHHRVVNYVLHKTPNLIFPGSSSCCFQLQRTAKKCITLAEGGGGGGRGGGQGGTEG